MPTHIPRELQYESSNESWVRQSSQNGVRQWAASCAQSMSERHVLDQSVLQRLEEAVAKAMLEHREKEKALRKEKGESMLKEAKAEAKAKTLRAEAAEEKAKDKETTQSSLAKARSHQHKEVPPYSSKLLRSWTALSWLEPPSKAPIQQPKHLLRWGLA